MLYSHLDDPMGEVCSALLLLLRSGVFIAFIIFSPSGMCVCWGGGGGGGGVNACVCVILKDKLYCYGKYLQHIIL